MMVIPGHLHKRLTISFWIWGSQDTGAGDVLHDLQTRMVELKERGFNCVRVDSGAGLCHDATGRLRGQVEMLKSFPGHGHLIRQMECCQGGRCDVLERLVELFEAAQRHDVQVILSSWFYLHTFWFLDARLANELLAVPPENRFMYFAKALDWIITALRERGLHKQLAFAEIFNEADGLPFITDYAKNVCAEETFHNYRRLHEEALDFLRNRHPDLLFAFDAYTTYVNQSLVPRNMQVWNLHSYYLWRAYDVFEGELVCGKADLNDPGSYASIRRFLRPELVPFASVKCCRGDRPLAVDNWYRRIWLYRNVDPTALPALEEVLSENLAQNVERYKQRATDAVVHAASVSNALAPGVPMVMGEAATYCALNAMRWEERSEAYWSVLTHMVGLLKSHGYWGCMPRTNSGPDDPAWTEFPERLRRLNQLFLEDYSN